MSNSSFTISTSRDGIIVNNASGSITISPAEVDAFNKFVSFILSVSELPAVPRTLSMHPFKMEFTDEGLIQIFRQEDQLKSMMFDPSEGDNLIKLVNMGVTNLVNDLKLSGSIRATTISRSPVERK